MVVGRYQANHAKGVDYIDLRPDGTYLYYYKGEDGKILTNTNTWKFERVNGKPTITFSKFVFGLPGYGSQKPGFWVVEVQRSFVAGNLRLCIDPDLGYYYLKKIH
jgi:hypothetical protein